MRLRLTRRRAAFLLLAVLAVLLVSPAPGLADVFSNVGPVSQAPPGSWLGRYPLGNYVLDQYFPAISVSFTSGVDMSGVGPMIAYIAAEIVWGLTAFISTTLTTLFAFAFNLDLLNGQNTGGPGALGPVAQAIHTIYANTFGQPWLIAAIVIVGVWAMWKALVQRRYAQTASALLTSLAYCVLAMGIVAQPARTIAPFAHLSDQMSQAFLSLTSKGTLANGQQAQIESSGQLFQTLVVDPWTVLEFGGIEHCVTANGHSTRVQPLSSDPATNTKIASQLDRASEAQAQGKRCVNNRNKYAPHFLAYRYQSSGRNAEYQALKSGNTGKLPSSDPAKDAGTYPLGAMDKPAAEAAGKGGQYERLLLAIVVFIGELGAWLLLGSLCAGVILAAIKMLPWLAFSPVALIAAVFPGRGHAFFIRWVGRIAGYLARKAIYALLLAILLAVCQALQEATSGLGWLMSFLLQAGLLWSVFLQRHRITDELARPATGSNTDRETGASRLQALYYTSRLTRMLWRGPYATSQAATRAVKRLRQPTDEHGARQQTPDNSKEAS